MARQSFTCDTHDLTTLMSYYRQIRRPVAVFVDTIDEYFEGYVDSVDPSEADASYLHSNKDSRIWIVGQLGICRAIRELLGVNPHVKIFVSIRKEAFNSLDYYDRNAVNISSLVVQLHYSGEDLLAATRGEVYCLDPSTGQIRWGNEMPGMGYGLICVAGSPNNVAAIEAMMEQERAADGAAAASAAT